MSRPFARRKLNPIIEEARVAYAEGDDTYVTGLELRSGRVATRKQLDQGSREMIDAIEAVGWNFADSRMADPYTIEFLFVR